VTRPKPELQMHFSHVDEFLIASFAVLSFGYNRGVKRVGMTNPSCQGRDCSENYEHDWVLSSFLFQNVAVYLTT
jgi:hypothetical protein